MSGNSPVDVFRKWLTIAFTADLGRLNEYALWIFLQVTQEAQMATDSEIAQEMDTYLRAKGYTCGRTYSDVGGVVEGIYAKLSNEQRATLRPKILRIAKERSWEFKVQGESVSASRTSDRDCGK